MTANHDDTASALAFDTILATVRSAGEDERERWLTIAEVCDLAHDAYALGIHHLQREEYDLAARRLRTALRHGLDDALPLLRHCERFVTVDSAQAVTEPAVTGDDSGIALDTGASLPLVAALGDATHSAAASGTPNRPAATADATNYATNGKAAGGVVLQASQESHARGMSSRAPGTIFARALTGGYVLGPGEGRSIVFGRSRPDVHVCIGEDDAHVSRCHGTLDYQDGQWRVRNRGRLPVRVAEQLLFPGEVSLPLGTGYTQIFVVTRHRQHLLEVFVTGSSGELPVPQHEEATAPPMRWSLTRTEHLVLVVFAQRYLLRERQPQPLSWRQTAEELRELHPEAGWTVKRVEHVVSAVRARLSRAGVSGLTLDEVGVPVGNTLNHNLIQELLMSTTLVPGDLALIDAA